jgi:hypothetical protein
MSDVGGVQVDEFIVPIEPATTPDPTTVYRFFGPRKQLLYVGITRRGYHRVHQHAHDKDWWQDVRSATFEHFPTRQDALWAEAEAIRSESPVHNIYMGQARLGRPGSLRPSKAGTETILSRAETMALLDKQAMRYFQMSGLELLHAWHAGEVSADDERFGYIVNLLAQLDG